MIILNNFGWSKSWKLRIVFVLATILSCIILFNTAHASKTKEIIASAQYILGDNDSKLDGRRIALMEAKRNALEKCGTYIESFTEVKNFQLARDEVRSYSAGILELKEAGEKWDKLGDNLSITLTIKVMVDEEIVTKQLAAIRKNSETSQELNDAMKKIREYEQKIIAMNRELQVAKTSNNEENKQQKSQQQIKDIQLARSQALTKIDVETLLAKARLALTGSEDENKGFIAGSTTNTARSRALTLLQEAFNLDPENPKVLCALGTISLEEKDYQKAETLYRKAINIDPIYAVAYNCLGFVLFLQNNISEAEQAMRKAISLKPGLAVSHHTLACILSKKGDLIGAIETEREAVRLNPKEALFIKGLGTFLYNKEGNIPEVRKLWIEACGLGFKSACESLNLLM